MTKSRGILTPRRKWCDNEMAMLRVRYADTPVAVIAGELGCKVHVVYRMAKKLRLRKSEAFLSGPMSGRTGFDDRGASFRFQPGHTSHNAGKVGLDVGGRSHDTRFKQGHRPRNWMPIGAHRVNSEGYLDRKICESKRGGANWCAVHRLVWIEAHGPVPPGHLVAFKPGRHTTKLSEITLDALQLITYEECMRRNSYHANYPKEIGELIRLKGQITREIRRREREKQD